MGFKIINLNKYIDERGCLVPIEALRDIDFEIKRIFYIYGNKNNLPRASHANKECQQVFICLSGKCKVFLIDKFEEHTYVLEKPDQALLVENYTWIELNDFSTDCILLVLASQYFNPNSYINDFEKFRDEIK